MLSISWNLPELGRVPAGAGQLASLFPRTAAAVADAAQLHHVTWAGFASGAPLPDGRAIGVRSGNYLRSLAVNQRGPFSWESGSSAPYAVGIEDGTPRFDMKQWLATSSKVRRAKDGSLYLIIPFRHGTPGTVGMAAMPRAVHALARQLSPSAITGTRHEFQVMQAHQVGPPRTVARFTYRWGDRLKGSKDIDKRYHGMYRFAHEDGKQSRYLTFRVMSSKSTGWIRPERAGFRPNGVAADQVRLLYTAAIQAAGTADLADWLTGARP